MPILALPLLQIVRTARPTNSNGPGTELGPPPLISAPLPGASDGGWAVVRVCHVLRTLGSSRL